MGRPRTARGESRGAKLPPLRVTTDEKNWLRAQVVALIAQGKRMTAGKFMRDRIFADMPGYKPEEL